MSLKYQPAFPQPLTMNEGRVDNPDQYGVGGMTFRQYVAAQVIQGLVTFENGERLTKLFDRERKIPDNGETPQQWFAQIAVSLADALILELEKKQ